MSSLLQEFVYSYSNIACQNSRPVNDLSPKISKKSFTKGFSKVFTHKTKLISVTGHFVIIIIDIMTLPSEAAMEKIPEALARAERMQRVHFIPPSTIKTKR